MMQLGCFWRMRCHSINNSIQLCHCNTKQPNKEVLHSLGHASGGLHPRCEPGWLGKSTRHVPEPCVRGLVAKSPRFKIATGTYPTGSIHAYPYPPSCTRWVTRNRAWVEKYFHTRTRAGKFYPTGNPHLTTYPRITYKYQTFTCKNISFQVLNKIQTNIHIIASLQYIY
jgi:hypothetical protein